VALRALTARRGGTFFASRMAVLTAAISRQLGFFAQLGFPDSLAFQATQ
jgi:hypothetical protein